MTVEQTRTASSAQEAYACLLKEIREGLQHGFFNYSIKCEIRSGKRHLTIDSGKSYKFVLSDGDLPSG